MLPKIGDEVKFFPRSGYGGHLAYIQVDKVNRRTFSGVERKGSYNQGKRWNVHIDSAYAVNGEWNAKGKGEV